MRRRLCIAMIFCFVIASSQIARADIQEVESLDLAVMRADVVVRGKVVKVLSEVEHKDLMVDTVTVNIEELLKGPDALKPSGKAGGEVPLPRVTFVVHSNVYESAIKNNIPWRNMQEEMLFVLDKHDDQIGTHRTDGRADYVLRPEFGKWSIALDETTALEQIYSAGKPIKSRAEILPAARTAAGRPEVHAEFGILPEHNDIGEAFFIEYPDTPDLRKAMKGLKIFMERK